jgi:hypothetical protein
MSALRGYSFGPTHMWIASSFWLALLLSYVTASIPNSLSTAARASAAGINWGRETGLTSIETLQAFASPYRNLVGQALWPNVTPPIQSIWVHPAFSIVGSSDQRKSHVSRAFLGWPTSNLTPANGAILSIMRVRTSSGANNLCRDVRSLTYASCALVARSRAADTLSSDRLRNSVWMWLFHIVPSNTSPAIPIAITASAKAEYVKNKRYGGSIQAMISSAITETTTIPANAIPIVRTTMMPPLNHCLTHLSCLLVDTTQVRGTFARF